MLASALRRLDESVDADHRVYAMETRAGVRKYTVMTPEDAWNQTCAKAPAHLYEVLSGPCNLYLDIEWKCPSAPNSDDEHEQVRNAVGRVCKQLQVLYGEDDPLVTLVSASGKNATGYKCSWHAHVGCKTVCWVNALAVGQFVRSTCKHIGIVDKVPYAGSGQNWRCVGSAKYSEPSRTFTPVDKPTFMHCTVQQPVFGRRVIYPDVEIPRRVAIEVPEHVRYLASTLNAGCEPMMSSPPYCIVPFRQRQFCEHVGRYHRSNHQYAVINIETAMWKMKCHACGDAIAHWTPFTDFAAVRAVFTAETAQYHSNSGLPAVMCSDSGKSYDLRCIGPPPRSHMGSGPVQCHDGVYTWHNST